MAISAKTQFDRALDHLACHSDEILSAHELFDIPLEELICSAVRKAFAIRAVSAQPNLFEATHVKKHR